MSRLLSDNGSSYVAGNLADWLSERGMDHVRGMPNHLMTQGKIERWYQTLKNRILLENYYLAGDLEPQISDFVGHYNHRHYQESLGNLAPADVYVRRDQTILLEREKIKRKTIELRRLQHQKQAAWINPTDDSNPPPGRASRCLKDRDDGRSVL